MKKLFALLLVVSLMATLFVGVGSAEGEFDWKAYEGTKIQVMFNQHNYQKAITDYGKLEEFKAKVLAMTGTSVIFSSPGTVQRLLNSLGIESRSL